MSLRAPRRRLSADRERRRERLAQAGTRRQGCRSPAGVDGRLPRMVVRRRSRPALWAASLLSAAPIAAAAADARLLAEDVIRDLDLQRGLPLHAESAPWRLDIPPETLWVVAVLGAGVLAYVLRDLLPSWRRRNPGGWTADPATAGDAAPPALAAATDADELARRGLLVEAMHVLLLRSLWDIRGQLKEDFADSLTSREILRSPRLPAPVRTPLQQIVTRVEWSYFGAHPAALDDYLSCRRSFDVLTAALRGQMV